MLHEFLSFFFLWMKSTARSQVMPRICRSQWRPGQRSTAQAGWHFICAFADDFSFTQASPLPFRGTFHSQGFWCILGIISSRSSSVCPGDLLDRLRRPGWQLRRMYLGCTTQMQVWFGDDELLDTCQFLHAIRTCDEYTQARHNILCSYTAHTHLISILPWLASEQFSIGNLFYAPLPVSHVPSVKENECRWAAFFGGGHSAEFCVKLKQYWRRLPLVHSGGRGQWHVHIKALE